MMQQEDVVRERGLAINDSIVFYCDLLGFSHQVRAAPGLASADTLVETLQSFAKEFTEDPQLNGFFGRKYWIFSDSMVAVWGMESEATQTMTEFDAILSQLSGLAAAQAVMMVKHRQPVRGGVARGWFREDADTVVSPALVRAAEIEKKVANPFIAIDADLYAYFVAHKGRSMYAPDSDPVPTLFIPPCDFTADLPALDYLMVGIRDVGLSSQQMLEAKKLPRGDVRDEFESTTIDANRYDFTDRHKAIVELGLSNADAGVRAKYLPLQQYHNRFVTMVFPRKACLMV